MSDLIEHNFPKEYFIGGWYIPKNICDNLISHFENNKHNSERGNVYAFEKYIVDLEVKNSNDLVCKFDDNNITQTYIKYLQSCLDNYIEKYKSVQYYNKFSLENSSFMIQHYPVGGGFKEWHFERGGISNSNRVLVFMTYLNNVDDGGTEFYYQNIRSPAVQGLTIIWPSDFTHTHRGQISNTKEKYILTGWYAFDE
jgi:hypothetical protein